MRTLVLISAAGAVGTAARYLLSKTLLQPGSAAFPVATLFVNFVGSFLISFLLPTALKRAWPEPITLALTTGLLGGFTTYSAFNYDLTLYFSEGQWLKGFGYMAATLIGCLIAGFAGLSLSR